MKQIHDVRRQSENGAAALFRVLAILAFVAIFSWGNKTAIAADTFLGELAVPSSTGFGTTFNDLEPGETDPFEDFVSFEALADASFSVLIDSLVDVSISTLTLFDGVGTVLASGTTQITATPLLAGNYDLQVIGLASGNQAGTTEYQGTIDLAETTVAPVPEPEIYAMMAVGLGVMGWAARRKKRKQVAA